VQLVEHRGGGFAYGITADPWWNPFSWNWSKFGRRSVSGLTRCGGGALKGALGIGGGVVTVNLIKKGAGTFMVRAAGDPYVYVAAGSCRMLHPGSAVMMPVRTLRQLLGLDRDTEYVTVPAQVTALVIAVAFAAYIVSRSRASPTHPPRSACW